MENTSKFLQNLWDDFSALHKYSASHASEIGIANHSNEATNEAAVLAMLRQMKLFLAQKTDEVVLTTHDTDNVVLATDELPAKNV